MATNSGLNQSKRKRTYATIGCVTGIIFGVVAVTFIILAAVSPTWFSLPFLSQPFRQVTGFFVLSEGGDGQAADILVVDEPPGATIDDNRGSRPSSVPVYLSFTVDETSDVPGGRELLWEEEFGRTQTDAGLPEINLSAGNGLLFVTVDDNIRALSVVDGEMAWESRLSDLVDERCVGCIQVVDDRVVVLTVDNVLQGFDAGTGRQEWLVRLNADTPPHTGEGRIAFAVVGDQLAIQDRIEDGDQSREAIVIYDPQDGQPIRELVPACSDWSVIDLAIVDPVTEQIVFVDSGTGFDPFCAESWDPETGQMQWQSVTDYSMHPAFSVSDLMSTVTRAEQVAYGPRFIFLGGDVPTEDLDGMIMAIDRQGGEVFRLLAKADYELAPLGATREMLALHARRTRGSERDEIWGIEVDSGANVWK
ncbi:MAG: PQQ-binding-like beta-propeller repeat protein [Candidatus Promineifilaceae bacterium]